MQILPLFIQVMFHFLQSYKLLSQVSLMSSVMKLHLDKQKNVVNKKVILSEICRRCKILRG